MGAGAGVAVALPALECMSPVGKAYAQTVEPKRLLMVHFGNGLHMREFTPWGGRKVAIDTPLPLDANASRLLNLFFQAGVGSDINVVTGLANPVDAENHTLRTVLTAAPPGTGISVDQVIAARNRSPNYALASLFTAPRIGFELAATMMCFSGPGDNNAVKPYIDPSALFTKLFGAVNTGPTPEQKRRVSVLDYVRESLGYVKSRASAQDLTLLDQHLTQVRSLEQRLAAPAPSCSSPGSPQTLTPGTTPAARKAWFDVMADLAVTALQCDLTRVAVLCLTCTGVDGITWAPGYEHHSVSHYDILGGSNATYQWQDAGAIDRAMTASVFQVSRVAETLARLKARQLASGQRLLDSTAFVGFSEYSAADLHSPNYLPVVTAGLGMKGGSVISYPCYLPNIGGGTPAPGAQLNNPNWVSHGMPQNCAEYGGTNVPLANLWLTLIRAMGIDEATLPRHGNSTGTLRHLWAPS